MSFYFSLSLNAGKPKVSLSFGPFYVEKGKNVTLPVCHVTSFPPAVITWTKVHDNLAQTRAVVVKDGRLSVINAQKKDSGLYKYKATNPLGVDSAVTQLVVVEVPQFTVRPPSRLDVERMQNITVRCQATGDPQPKVTWTKESGELPVRRSEAGVDGTLKIWNSVGEDSGIYTCVASLKEFFKAFSAMRLIVEKGKEEFNSKILYLLSNITQYKQVQSFWVFVCPRDTCLYSLKLFKKFLIKFFTNTSHAVKRHL